MTRRFVPYALLFVLLLGLFWLFTARNDFPFYYHTDEPGKVDQIITGARNFHHPLLMINATNLALRLTNRPRSRQAVVITGRYLSASFAILAIAGVALLARRLLGWVLGLFVALIAGLHPFLFEAAHFMKEDTFLLAGLAWSWVAFESYCRKGSIGAIVAMGLATGLAISGKFVGLFALVFAVGLVLYQTHALGPRKVLWHLVILLAVSGCVFAIIDFQAVTHLGDASRGLASEIVRAKVERGYFRPRNYFVRFAGHAGLFLVSGLVLYLTTCFDRSRKKTKIEWALLCFLVTYLAMLSMARLGRDRYLLPITTLATVFAVSGLLSFAELIHRKWKRIPVTAVTFCIGGLLAIPSVLAALQFEGNLRYDERRQAFAWVAAHLPAASAIICNVRTLPEWPMPGGEPSLPQRIISSPSDPSRFGSVENLRRSNIDYVVVADRDYRNLVGEPGVDDQTVQKFYRELEGQCEAVWKIPRGENVYIAPGFTIYRVVSSVTSRALKQGDR